MAPQAGTTNTRDLTPDPAGYQVDDLTIDLAPRRVRRAGTVIPLKALSFDLLVALVRAAPNLVSFDQLSERVWPGLVVTPETIVQRVKLLRSALGDDSHAPRYIEGVRGRGYRMIAEVRPLTERQGTPESIVPPSLKETKEEESPNVHAGIAATGAAAVSSPSATPSAAPRPARWGPLSWIGGTLIIVVLLAAHLGGGLRVLAIDRKQRRRNPAPPFTTSTLQQEAARKLGFNARRTMRLAQQLYEGQDIGEGSVGLITYMRTDSVSLAAEAVREIREVAARLYGKDEVAEEPRVYKTKSKNAQEAHEAIRPTAAHITPADVEGRIEDDLYRLYALIWKRAVASQMSHALFDTVAVDMLAGPDGTQRHLLRANGSTLVKPGYISVYQEGTDDAKAADDSDHVLPPMNEGDAVHLSALRAEQHFTEPPPRYSEASLVKALEEHGIGRPSTYASIISTLQDREYVEMDSRRFVPTDIGKIVCRFLTHHFHRYVEYGFTAAMEDELDAVSRGEEDWTTPLDKFWKPFIHQVEKIEKTVTREQVAQARELGRDPATGKPITVRMGRYGPFVQIGTKDDEEKPRFAGLRPGQKMDALTLADAMELFKLPRTLGETAQGEAIVANVGRFGPYVKYGSKYASLKEDDPYTVTLERAREVIRLKQEADANRIIQDFPAEGIQVLNGRYGPYITDRKKNAKIPKDRDPRALTLEECRALLAAAPVLDFARPTSVRQLG